MSFAYASSVPANETTRQYSIFLIYLFHQSHLQLLYKLYGDVEISQ